MKVRLLLVKVAKKYESDNRDTHWRLFNNDKPVNSNNNR